MIEKKCSNNEGEGENNISSGRSHLPPHGSLLWCVWVCDPQRKQGMKNCHHDSFFSPLLLSHATITTSRKRGLERRTKTFSSSPPPQPPPPPPPPPTPPPPPPPMDVTVFCKLSLERGEKKKKKKNSILRTHNMELRRMWEFFFSPSPSPHSMYFTASIAVCRWESSCSCFPS